LASTINLARRAIRQDINNCQSGSRLTQTISDGNVQLQAAGGLRARQQGLRARGPGQFQGHPLVRGCRGHRDYEWALVATSSPANGCWSAARSPTPLTWRSSTPTPGAGVLAHPDQGRRQEVASRGINEQAKGQTGLDQHQLLIWPSFHRHTVLSMCALACSLSRPPGHPEPVHPRPLPIRTPAPPASRNTGATPAICPSVPTSSLPRTWA
jgi:hypothetical protein